MACGCAKTNNQNNNLADSAVIARDANRHTFNAIARDVLHSTATATEQERTIAQLISAHAELVECRSDVCERKKDAFKARIVKSWQITHAAPVAHH